MGAEEAGRGRRQASDEGAKQQQGEQTSRGGYRWAELLILSGSLMLLVSLLVLFMVSILTGSVEGDYARSPGAGQEESPSTEVLPGESAEEYRWRTDAEEQQAAARAHFENVLAALDPAAPSTRTARPHCKPSYG